ncbi:MAG: hypothetical protein HY791_26820 [Deltaproteobacteria bacterium]|nr:hypothetical protein [Deltaproteobacteria bacterium]
MTKARTRIAARKIAVSHPPIIAELANAKGALAEKIGALGSDRESRFEEAEAAVQSLEDVIERGETAAEKDPKYKKELAAATKSLGAERAKKKLELAALEERSKLEEAAKAAREAVDPIEEDSQAGAISAAETAIGALESALDGVVNKKALTKNIATEKKALATLVGRRVEDARREDLRVQESRRPVRLSKARLSTTATWPPKTPWPRTRPSSSRATKRSTRRSLSLRTPRPRKRSRRRRPAAPSLRPSRTRRTPSPPSRV